MGTCEVEQKLTESGAEPVFQAGNIKNHVDQWKLLISDPWILEVVNGCRLELDSVLTQLVVPQPIKFRATESLSIQREIDIFLEKGFIVKSRQEEGEYISNIFTRPKKSPGKVRVILNSRPLNQHLTYHKFKMDTVHTGCTLLKQNCYMASLDLQDAYYSVPVHPSSQKFLKFFCKGQLFSFTCLPMGLATAPRVFTKLLKPVFAKLRQMGHLSSIYIDDVFLLGDTYELCGANVCDTENVLIDLGFYVQRQKSVRIPTKILTHFRYVFNTDRVTVALTQEKIAKLTNLVHAMLEPNQRTSRQVTELIGMFISYSVSMEYGAMHLYRSLEVDKIRAVRANYGSFDARMTLSQDVNMNWWLQKEASGSRKLRRGAPMLVLTTDASKEGWGGLRTENEHSVATGGRWSEEKKRFTSMCLKCWPFFAPCKPCVQKIVMCTLCAIQITGQHCRT